MSNFTTTISFEHGKGNESSNLDDGELCEDEIEVVLEWEPGDSNYGADADGNRGISVPGYMTAISDPPNTCPECGHTYSEEEKAAILREMETKATNFERDYEPDYPEPYEY